MGLKTYLFIVLMLATLNVSASNNNIDIFFYRGEYVDKIKYTHKDWMLIEVSTEEDIDTEPRMFALTQNQDTALMFYYWQGTCQFMLRYFIEAESELARLKQTNIASFVIDNQPHNISSAIELINLLRNGKSITVTQPHAQTYSLSGTHKILQQAVNIFSKKPNKKCDIRW